MDLPRLKTVNVHSPLDVDCYSLPETVQGAYVVDDSNFVPMAEAVRQLGANNVGSVDVKSCYDFVDGADNGMEIPLGRRKDCKDIAEISANIMKQVEETTEHIRNEKDYQNRKKSFEKSLNSIKSDSSNSSNSSNISSSE